MAQLGQDNEKVSKSRCKKYEEIDIELKEAKKENKKLKKEKEQAKETTTLKGQKQREIEEGPAIITLEEEYQMIIHKMDRTMGNKLTAGEMDITKVTEQVK